MGENATAAAVLTQEGTEEQAERTHNSDEESDEEDPYVSTHFDGQLPAAKGDVARAVNAQLSPEDQRTQAQEFFAFLYDMQSELQLWPCITGLIFYYFHEAILASS
jgi:hypothetical protein